MSYRSTKTLLMLAILFAPLFTVAQPYPAADPEKLQVLIITGRHVHYWPDTTPVLRKVLEDTGRFEVRVTEEFRGATSRTLDEYDLLVVNYYDRRQAENLRWGEDTEQAFEEFVKSGKGVVMYHLALGAFYHWEEYEKMSGGNWREGRGHHSPQHDFEVDIINSEHPITRGLKTPLSMANDELYANLIFQPEGSYDVLATAYDNHSLYGERARQPIPGPGIVQPILWTTQYGEGRVFVTTLGHDEVDAAHQTFVTTFTRGAEWAATGEVSLEIPPELAD
jgi:type 1 glutamine amidotransferase